jgi:hypothetical protein
MNSKNDFFCRLARDVPETTRSNLQHEIYKATLGYSLHPKISIRENIVITDVVTAIGASSLLLLDRGVHLTYSSSIFSFDRPNLL